MAEFEHAVNDIARRIYNEGLSAEVREEIKEELGWKFLGKGISRATFLVSPEHQEGPVDTPTRQAPCVVKFGTSGMEGGISDGPVQNREEIHNFEKLPESLTGTDRNVPLFVPISDYDRDDYLWISAPEVDPDGGSTMEAEERLAQNAWKCADIHPGNVGSIHGETVILDYGVDCEPTSTAADDAEAVARKLERLDCRGVVVDADTTEATVEFLPPDDMPTVEPVKHSSEIHVRVQYGDVGVTSMKLWFGTWNSQRDDVRAIEEGLEHVVDHLFDEWGIGGIDASPDVNDEVDGDVEAELGISLTRPTSPAPAADIYEIVLDGVRDYMPAGNPPRPDTEQSLDQFFNGIEQRMERAAEQRRRRTGIPENLAGIEEGDVIDHPEFVNPITVEEIDADDGVVVVADSNDHVYDYTFSDNAIQLYDWKEHLVEEGDDDADPGLSDWTRTAVFEALRDGTHRFEFEVPGVLPGGDKPAIARRTSGAHVIYEAADGTEHATTPKSVVNNLKRVIPVEETDDEGIERVPERAELLDIVDDGGIVRFRLPNNFDNAGSEAEVTGIRNDGALKYRDDDGNTGSATFPAVAENVIEIVEPGDVETSDDGGPAVPEDASKDIIDVFPAADDQMGDWQVLLNGEVKAVYDDHDHAVRLARRFWEPGVDRLTVQTPDGREVQFEPGGDVEQQTADMDDLLGESTDPGGQKIEVLKDLGGEWQVFVDAQQNASYEKWADAVDRAHNLHTRDDELVIEMPGGESDVRVEPGESFNLGMRV